MYLCNVYKARKRERKKKINRQTETYHLRQRYKYKGNINGEKKFNNRKKRFGKLRTKKSLKER